MKALLLNVHDNIVKVLDIEDELEDYYREIGCQYIEIVQRKIGRKWFDVICDEEGTYREDAKVSAIDNFGRPMFVGNLLFMHHDNNGNMTELSDTDIKYITERIQTVYTRLHPDGYLMLTQCEYI